MKENYKAWTVNIDDFHKQLTEAEKIKFLLNFAVLAPSSHNSQPWRFEISGNEIKIFLEPSRRLVESDKNDRQSYISIGCAIKNVSIAAEYYDFSCDVKYLSNSTIQIIFSKNSAAHSSNKNHLIFSIPKRVTNRNRYENALPSELFLQEIKNYSTDDLRVYIITDQDQKKRLADIALAASIAAMDDKNFRRELSQYVKSNTTSSPVGMPCFGMDIPTPVSFIAPTMIKYLNMNKLSHKKDEALLKNHTPVFVVVATQKDDKINWIKTGQIYERIALLAVREGLLTAMWAAPIQIGEYHKDFQKVLNTEFRPQAFFRLGYASKKMSHSPRLPARNVITLPLLS